MALVIAVKFRPGDMPRFFDPGQVDGLRPNDFVVCRRDPVDDVGFVAALEYRSREQLSLLHKPLPRIVRRATEDELTYWRERELRERAAMTLCKEKVRELNLPLKISKVQIDVREGRTIFQFTAEQRVDFRALVRELSLILKTRVELWQNGVREEARLIDGVGICGLRTCCSSWMTDFHPVNLRQAKEQDINLPPAKLSGQCGRLLCCLSYEVDLYRDLTREFLPKGATIQLKGKMAIILDRNVIAGTYLVRDEGGTMATVKAAEIQDGKVPEQMKGMARTLGLEDEGRRLAGKEPETPRDAGETPEPGAEPRGRQGRPQQGQPRRDRGEGERPSGHQERRRHDGEKRPHGAAPADQREPREPREHREHREPAQEGQQAGDRHKGRRNRRRDQGHREGGGRPESDAAPQAGPPGSERPRQERPQHQKPRDEAQGEKPEGEKQPRGRHHHHRRRRGGGGKESGG